MRPSRQIRPNVSLAPDSFISAHDHQQVVHHYQTRIQQLEQSLSQMQVTLATVQHAYTSIAQSQSLQRQAVQRLPEACSEQGGDVATIVINGIKIPTAEYPDVYDAEKHDKLLFWHKADYGKYMPTGSLSDFARVQGCYRYLEMSDGTTMTEGTYQDLRSVAKRSLITLDDAGLAPPTWGSASSHVFHYMQHVVYKRLPSLLSERHWKLQLFLTRFYPDFRKGRPFQEGASGPRARAASVAPSKRERTASVVPDQSRSVKRPRLQGEYPPQYVEAGPRSL